MTGTPARAINRATGLVVVLLAVTLLAACGGDDDDASSDGVEVGGLAVPGGPVAWPAPPSDEVAELASSAGLALEKRESLTYHSHAHLDVFIDGEHRTVPAGIGIVISDPAVKKGTIAGSPAYGGIEGCDQPCISPLHTHDVTGIIHTESATDEGNTLGQLFQQWDVALDADCVGSYCTDDTAIRIYVDGDELPLADAADLPLTNFEEIAIVIGTPPDRVPNRADFSEG